MALLSLVPFALLAGWARVASPAPWEPGLVATVALGLDPPAQAVRAINALGDFHIWAAMAAIGSVALYLARGLVAASLLALSVAADLVAAVVKVIVERGRPEGVIVESLLGPDSYAFPSGHVVRAVAFAAVMAWLFAPPSRRLPLAIVAALAAGALMGFSRVALGVHWPTDALGGLLLGVGWFALTTLLVAREPRAAGRGM